MNCAKCRRDISVSNKELAYEANRLIFCSEDCKVAFYDKFNKNIRMNLNDIDYRWEEFLYDNTVLSHRYFSLDQDDRLYENWFTFTAKDGSTKTYVPDYIIQYMDGTTVVEDVVRKVNFEDGIEHIKQECKNRGFVYRCLNSRSRTPINIINERYENDYGFWQRPTFEYIFMNLAEQIASRSTCVRTQVGAIFVDDSYQKVLAIGYNGGLPNDKNQCESLLPGKCGCIHAEQNAMMKATESLNGSTLFVTLSPCIDCAKSLILRGIKRVIYNNAYRDDSGIKLLIKAGVIVVQWKDFVEHANWAHTKIGLAQSNIKPNLQHYVEHKFV